MSTNLAIVEERFQQYLPVLKELYPEDRKDKAAVKKFIEQYQEMMILSNVVVALFDDRNSSIFCLSSNVEKITGHKSSTLINWGALLLFKIIHPSHYSYAFNAIRYDKKFFDQLSFSEAQNSSFSAGGVKMIDGKGQTQLSFMKAKTLLWTNDGQPDLTIIFWENVSHLMKSGHYWLRYEAPFKKYAFVNQKGKKHFSDLISESELRILKLAADKKSNSEISDELFLSKSTVETHRKNMIKRVGAVNSTALVHLCRMANII